jgi:hypothetical protein
MRVDGGERKKMLESKKVSTKIFKFGESEYDDDDDDIVSFL